MKAEKFRELGEEELETKEHDIRDEIFRLRIKKATGQLDQFAKIQTLRRDLARVKTILRERHGQHMESGREGQPKPEESTGS